jgi:hypothetical protein
MEACVDDSITQQAFLAGGSGACDAPDGECEGQSPLARSIHRNGELESARGRAHSQIIYEPFESREREDGELEIARGVARLAFTQRLAAPPQPFGQ